MDKYEDEVDVYERFAYLFKPAANLLSNFEINIGEILSQCDDNPSFVTAAAIIQGTSNVYARKVDLLHKMSIDFCYTFNNAPQKKKKGKNLNLENKDDNNGNGRDKYDQIIIHADDEQVKKANLNKSTVDHDSDYSVNASSSRIKITQEKDDERYLKCYVNQISVSPCLITENGMIQREVEDGLCIFETFSISDHSYIPCYVSKVREFNLLFHMPGNMMPLMDFEKRKLSLFGLYGKYAEIDDYKLIRDIVSYDNALTFEGCNLILNQNAIIDRRQSSAPYVAEICRRISEGIGIEFAPMTQISRVESEHISNFQLNDLPPSQPPAESIDVSFNQSFAAPEFVNPEPETRRSERIASRQNSRRDGNNVETEVDLLQFLDIYDDIQYKFKPYKICKNIDVRSVDLQKKRDNFIKRKAEKENIVNVDSLHNFMQSNFFRKSGKNRGDPVMYTVNHQRLPSLTLCMRREKIRRNELKIEMRKKQIESRRLRERQVNSEDAARNATIDRLNQDIANFSTNAPECNDDEWDGEINVVAATPDRETPAPLGDFIPDQIDDFAMYSRLSRVTRRNTAATNQTVNTQNNQNDLPESDYPQPPPALTVSMSDIRDLNDALRNMQGIEGATPETIANMVQVALAEQWQAILEYQPVRHANYVKWEKKMMPILVEMKDDFMADQYGKIILQQLNGEIGKRIKFKDLTKSNPMERARFLLTTLMFVNRGTLKIHTNTDKSTDNDENNDYRILDGNTPEDFEIELLIDAEWHGDALNQSGLFT